MYDSCCSRRLPLRPAPFLLPALPAGLAAASAGAPAGASPASGCHLFISRQPAYRQLPLIVSLAVRVSRRSQRLGAVGAEALAVSGQDVVWTDRAVWGTSANAADLSSVVIQGE